MIPKNFRTPRGRRQRPRRNDLTSRPLSLSTRTRFSYRTGGIKQYTCFIPSVVPTTSSAGGVVALAIPLRPSDSASFSDLTNLYEEFRIVEVSLSLLPLANNYGISGANDGMAAVLFDPNTTGTYTSMTQFAEHESAWVGSLVSMPGGSGAGRALPPYRWRAPPPALASNPTPSLSEWQIGAWTQVDILTGTPASGSFQVRCEPVAVSSNILLYMVGFIVQFRGRR